MAGLAPIQFKAVAMQGIGKANVSILPAKWCLNLLVAAQPCPFLYQKAGACRAANVQCPDLSTLKYFALSATGSPTAVTISMNVRKTLKFAGITAPVRI